MESTEVRPFTLVIERDPSVRSALYSAAEDRIHFRFEDRLTEIIADRKWMETIPPVRVAFIEIPDTKEGTLGLLARFREANPGLPVILNACYGREIQLAAERLEALSEEIIYRPFDVGAVVTTMRGFCSGIGVA